MAKPTTVKIKLESTAGTGFYYVAKKNARTMTYFYHEMCICFLLRKDSVVKYLT